MSIGFIHEAIWSGSTIEDGEQPNSFSDFLRVFIAEDRKKEDYNIVPDTHLNALGNHLGVWEFLFQKSLHHQKIKFYYQHFFEDTSGLRFRNQFDGLWGLELENYIPKTNILIEYLNASNSKQDSYYNHGTYKLGWSYKNYTLGNPFVNHLNINPVNVLHLAIDGEFLDYSYQMKVSKKINISDFIKYKIDINKKINTVNSVGIFIVNNDNKIGLGVNILWIL